jgi:cytochrome d ubiquinol oxidase, subunit II
LFTLQTMSVVSILVPFVVAYIAYVWYVMDKKKLDKEELKDDELY